MEYLAFVDEIGRTVDGKYLYRFDFTEDTDVVWGDFFNVVPSVIIPDLRPEKNCLSSTARAIFPCEMIIAKKSFCFSIQDCIDGLTPLIFSEIKKDGLSIDDVPFFLRFGEPIDTVKEKLNKVGIELTDFEEVEKGDDTAIDDLIDSIPDENFEE